MRNTHSGDAWERLLALWSPSAPAKASAEGSLVFVSLDGRRTLSLRESGDDQTDDATAGSAVPFRHHQRYPASAPDAPDAPFLLVVRAVATDDRDREDFRRWLREEHGPRQTTLPGVRWLHAYEQEGAEHSFLNLWGIDDPAVVDSEAWVQVRRSPWWDRVAHVPATAERGVYRRSRSPEG